jgi:hypothetical protein
MMLSTWLYASSCTLNRAEALEAVHQIVDVSRPTNRSLDVTGALIWTGTRFAQFLEGPDAGVAALRETILRDPRHHSVQTIEASETSARMFAGWSLAYSGTASFVERELKRICEQAGAGIGDSAKDLKLLLAEFERPS